MPTTDGPVYRLKDREGILPEKTFRQNLTVTGERHPPAGGWEAAKGAFLTRFREAFADGRWELAARFARQGSGREVANGHALLTDRLIHHLWRLLPAYVDLPHPRGPLCVAAVGGYGRAELFPYSDVDLLVLHDDTADSAAALAEPFLHFLWDIGLPVSHALRTPGECIADAREDITIQTSLLEARLLAGDRELFGRFRERYREEVLSDFPGFLGAKQGEQRERHERFGGPVYQLEPNVKESWGGLRDLHLLFWAARYRFRLATLRGLVPSGILSAAEYRALARSQQLLWRVRAGLHYLAGRNENRLLFDYQHTLAADFGFRDTAATLAVEKFMKRYFRTLRQVGTLTDIGIQTLAAESPAGPSRRLAPGLLERSAHLEAADPSQLHEDPAAIVDFFARTQRLDRLPPLGATTLRALWAGGRRVTGEVRARDRVRVGLLRLLSRPGRVGETLRRMNAAGLLGRFVPELGRIVGQTQHNLYHVYPVDEHTLRAIENIDAFHRGEPGVAEESPLACRITPKVRRPEVLYLGMMCHDIAKGRAGDHSVLGARIARRLGRRLGMDAEDAATAAWLVADHLFLSQNSQKRDIHDPRTIGEIANRARSEERLDLLYLLTEADMRATGPKVWNTWKAQLLADLYLNTRQVLRKGLPADAETRIRRVRRRIIRGLSEEGFTPERVRSHMKRLGRDYLLHYHPEELIQHTRILLAGQGPTMVEVAPHPRAGGTEILVYTPDRPGLFTLATGTLAALGLNIAEAKVHTTRDHWALDTFIVLDHEDHPVTDKRARGHIRDRLQAAFTRPSPLPPTPSRQEFRERAQRHFRTPVEVAFSPATTGDQTVAEVVAPDAPGVLYRIARVLSGQGCEIHAAKVATFGERTEDTFFISKAGGPLSAPRERRALARAIQRELEPEPAEA